MKFSDLLILFQDFGKEDVEIHIPVMLVLLIIWYLKPPDNKKDK